MSVNGSQQEYTGTNCLFTFFLLSKKQILFTVNNKQILLTVSKKQILITVSNKQIFVLALLALYYC